jgi:hypothetical protein
MLADRSSTHVLTVNIGIHGARRGGGGHRSARNSNIHLPPRQRPPPSPAILACSSMPTTILLHCDRMYEASGARSQGQQWWWWLGGHANACAHPLQSRLVIWPRCSRNKTVSPHHHMHLALSLTGLHHHTLHLLSSYSPTSLSRSPNLAIDVRL